METPQVTTQERRGTLRLTAALFALTYVYFFGALQSTGAIIQSSRGLLKEMAGFILALCAVCLLIAADFRGFRRVLNESRVIVAFCGLALLSCLWSNAPGRTIIESLHLIAAVACGVAAAAHLGADGHLRVLTNALLIIAIGSAAVCLLVPSYGLMREEFIGAWRGVFVQKNTLGRIMALGVICGAVGILDAKHVVRSALLLFLALALVILSRSRTALLLVLGLLAVLPCLRLIQKQPRIFRVVGGTFVLAAGVAVVWELTRGTLIPSIQEMARAVAYSLGKDLTFTGRDIIWRSCIALGMERPLLGYGYSAFWSYPGPAGWVWEATGWRAPMAHNGYIELWLGLGLAGLCLYIPVMLTFFARSVRYLVNVRNWAAIWPALCFLFIAISACDESILVKPIEQAWIIIIVWGSILRTPLQKPSSQ